MAHNDSIGLFKSDNIALTLPFHYSFGLIAALLGSLAKGCNIAISDSVSLPPSSWFNMVGATVVNTTPIGARALLNCHSNFRVLTIGGDLTSPKLASQIIGKFPQAKVFTTYGLTEAGPRVATLKLNEEVLEGKQTLPLGQPIAGVELEMQPDANKNNLGELMIRSPYLMAGYFQQPEATMDALGPNRDLLGSGDLFRKEADQYHFVSRRKRMISRGGEKIYPTEIENIICSIDGVDDAWVYGAFHPELSEVPSAYVVAGRNWNQKSLRKELRRLLQGNQLPESIHFVNELPVEAKRK